MALPGYLWQDRDKARILFTICENLLFKTHLYRYFSALH